MWKWYQVYCVLVYLCAITLCQKSGLDTPNLILLVRTFRNWGLKAFGQTGMDEEYLQLSRDADRVQDVIPDDVPFPCNVTGGRSPQVPDSVHKLRPGDIDVIGAIGDSITAGAGIFGTQILHVLVENRGVTAAGGGQGTWRQYMTLPNILKEYNPNLIGYALGDSLASHEAAQLNVAESGAFSEDMPFMAEVLVTRIKKHPKIDLQKDWKFVSIMIGSNDFCTDVCWVPSPWSILEKHREKMLQTLRTLRDNLPRTFVALILPPHLKVLIQSKTAITSLLCYLTGIMECSCLCGLAYRKSKETYYDIISRWQDIDLEIASYPEFQRNDFVVVAQPVLADLYKLLPEDEKTLKMFAETFLTVDCFHISQKANSLYAVALWNNLFVSVDSKMRYPDLSLTLESVNCPTVEQPYLATMKNSRKQS